MGALSILVTGANGFLGRAVADAAMAAGHQVRRHGRAPGAGVDHAVDLGDPAAFEALCGAVAGVDAVIHTASAMVGDDAVHARDTIAATEALCRAMSSVTSGASGVESGAHLVLISSIAVYDADALPEGAVVDETAPLERDPARRDAYARAKLLQEAVARQSGVPLWCLRPGAIFAPGRLWNAHIGPKIGPVLFSLGRGGELPLVSVHSCAEAAVLAAEKAPEGDKTVNDWAVNIVDDNLPDRAGFLSILGVRATRVLSWRVLDVAGQVLGALPGIGPRLPGLLRPGALRARMRPARYSNARAKALLGWQAGDARARLVAAKAAEGAP